MDIEQTIKAVAVMQAWLAGKTIQFAAKNGSLNEVWTDVRSTSAAWDWHTTNYRVKPEPTLRPFTAEEAQRKLLGKRVRRKQSGSSRLIIGTQGDASIAFYDGHVTAAALLTHYELINDDGTCSPCGVMSE